MTPALTAVVCCRGRLAHLRQTLPLYAGTVPVVVVDYGCPDGCGDWVSGWAVARDHLLAEQVTVVDKTADRWHAADARNTGLRFVRTPFVAFVDADTKVLGDLSALAPAADAYYVAHHDGPPPGQPELPGGDWFHPSGGDDLCGFVLCPAAAARSIGGYCTDFVGWGAEDTDFRTRLALDAGLRHGRLPRGFLEPIPHGHALRHGVPEAAAEAEHAARVDESNRRYHDRHAARPRSFPPAAPCPLTGLTY